MIIGKIKYLKYGKYIITPQYADNCIQVWTGEFPDFSLVGVLPIPEKFEEFTLQGVFMYIKDYLKV